MNITKNTTGNLSAVISVAIDKADYQEKVDDVLKQYKKTANIKGFRKGHVPMSFVKKQYEKPVIFDVVNELLQKELNNYINEEKISILGNPIPVAQDNIDWDADQLTFDFEIGLAPEIEVDLKAIEVPAYEIYVSDEEVDKYVKNFAQRYGKMENVDTVEENTVLKVEVKEKENEDAVKNAYIRLDEVKDQKVFVGKKVNDTFDINTKEIFEEEENAENVFNLSKEAFVDGGVELVMTIKEINKITDAAIDQELFDKVYGEGSVDSEEAFRDKIKSESEKMYAKETDRQLMNEVVEKVIENTKVELPEEFLIKWLQFSNENITSEEQAKDELEKISKSLKYQLIESRLAEAKEIEVTADEVKAEAEKAIREQLAMYGQNAIPEETMQSIIGSALTNQEEYNRLSYQVFTDKMLAVYKEGVKMSPKKVTLDEFIAIVTKENKDLEEEA
ncbi:trigger factor [Weeksella virosa]|uniref:Trigger factor n=1 Tax=Weeksella virosa (strain ATCC 43766 / DSM 16922 / JCM 21250 / CCUG 30538 / CDC 9751 / IAM 14551 / NBRC 16016 / NCTC 11634 / CL345/78) TaxID=865938 RepID=F0NYM3_WEEVC|nr:trigger factor [Weeksella virosa]ADX68154.1 trigger factor [Weeksella virosa DSM 16922]MDK7675495.1 trigger factor [Weeksella virosa]SUP54465.1 Trigger factor [Weeksella virosa]VEH64211.1 Trigger factor [Weeksella virosa]